MALHQVARKRGIVGMESSQKRVVGVVLAECVAALPIERDDQG